MDSQKPKYSYAEKRKAATQQLSADRREALLLSRRTRRQNSLKHAFVEIQNVSVPEEPTSSGCKIGFRNRSVLTIREPASQPETAELVQPCALTSVANLDKGKGIYDPSITTEIAAPVRLCSFTAQPNSNKGKAICDPSVVPEIAYHFVH